MTEPSLCVSIPVELQKYQKQLSITESPGNNNAPLVHDFGVKLVKNAQGELDYSAYYSDSGELLKRIYYKGSSVSCIKHYRNNLLYTQEEYADGKMRKKNTYDKNGRLMCITKYEYNRQDQIVGINKRINNNHYEVKYGYDELNRINSRKISVNLKIVNEQSYKYDILDRIVEYDDSSQRIKVNKINPKNELINYTIYDKAGNEITIINKYLCSEYIGTEIDLNGHKTSIKDKTYTDNVVLKRPYTSEDDLDFAISNMFIKPEGMTTKRARNTDISDSYISIRMQDNKPLPISMRKILLVTDLALSNTN